jgi:dTDP-D-glucose 4,6-dehydratase
MKKIIRLTESDLARIIRRVIMEGSISEIYKVITDEEIENFKMDLLKLLNGHILGKMNPENYLRYNDIQHSYNLWRKKNMSKYTRRPSKRFDDEIEYDELSKNEQEELIDLKNTNIKKIGKLFEELIDHYERKYDLVGENSEIESGIKDVLSVLNFEYTSYLEHIMYPKKSQD